MATLKRQKGLESFNAMKALAAGLATGKKEPVGLVVDPWSPPHYKHDQHVISVPCLVKRGMSHDLRVTARAFFDHEIGESEVIASADIIRDDRYDGRPPKQLFNLANAIGDGITIDPWMANRFPGSARSIYQQVQKDLDKMEMEVNHPDFDQSRIGDVVASISRYIGDGLISFDEAVRRFPMARHALLVVEQELREIESLVGHPDPPSLAEQGADIAEAMFEKLKKLNAYPDPPKGKKGKPCKRGEKGDVDGPQPGPQSGDGEPIEGDEVGDGKAGETDEDEEEQSDSPSSSEGDDKPDGKEDSESSGEDTGGEDTESDGESDSESDDASEEDGGSAKAEDTVIDQPMDTVFDDDPSADELETPDTRLQEELEGLFREAEAAGSTYTHHNDPTEHRREVIDHEKADDATVDSHREMFRQYGAVLSTRMDRAFFVPGPNVTRGERRGTLDERSLTKLVDGSYRSFKQVTPSERKDVAISLVVDESSSMDHPIDGKTYGGPTLADCARQTTLVWADAAERCDAPLDILGFGGRRRFRQLKGFDESFMDRDVQRRVAGIQAAGGTPMADAIEIAGQRLAARPEKLKLLFVATDGAPRDSFAVSHVIDACLEQGIVMIFLGIAMEEPEHLSFTGKVPWVTVEDPKHLANVASKELVKAILRRRS